MSFCSRKADTDRNRLFRPVRIPSLGSYEDGGLKHNNPINIALWESRYIWPSITKPDVVLSLGTGHQELSHSPVVSTPKPSVRDMFVFRLWRSFMASIDGQSVWRDLMNRLDEQARRDFFRLTVCFSGPEPAPDDFTSMESLSLAVQIHPQGPEDRRRVMMALLISSLYFELDRAPQYEGGGLYYASGTIRCRSSGALRSLLSLYPYGLEYFNGPVSLARFVSLEDLCKSCGRYARPIHFFTRSLDEQVALNIRWEADEVRNVSAMPQPLSWFTRMQRLDSPFYTEQKRHDSRCGSCSTRSADATSRKRQRSSSPGRKGEKRKKVEI